MRANPFVGLAIALTACLLFVPAARAQDVGDCPDNTCVESQTSLVFNPATHTMDAFTTATTDYNTSYWYDLCVNLAVMRVNGPYVVNWDILWPSTTPSSCVSGAVELEDSASVAATPGRQYFAEGLVELYVFYTYSEITYPDCGDYCTGYWYDAEGYSLLSTSQPSNANWPSIEYSYPYLDEPEPVASQSLAMMGSGATAWAPPVIYSVNPGQPPNPWPAGLTTTFTISGAGFGYSPTLTISGNGVTGYTNPCASSPSSSCDSTIVATVTIDANTPTDSQETVTVMAGGQNPSGFLPVDTGYDQNQQVTAQATTTAPPVPQIWFNGSCVSNSGTPSCSGAPVSVVVGQQIALTVQIPSGVTPTSQQWTQPTGTVVGGYAASTQSGQLTPFPNPSQPCQQLNQACLTFYWVVPSATGTPWQVSYSYNNQPNTTVTATFNVGGPTPTGPNGAFFTAAAGYAQALALPGPTLRLNGVPIPSVQKTVGILFTRSAASPQSILGTYSWVQLVQSDQIRALKPDASGNTVVQTCWSFQGPAIDNYYPAPAETINTLYDTNVDSPNVSLPTVWGELQRLFSLTIYLMWDPTLPGQGQASCQAAATTGDFNTGTNTTVAGNCTGSIPVPLASMTWQTPGDAINTQQTQPPPNSTTWIAPCGPATNGTCVAVTPNTAPAQSFPIWQKLYSNVTANCH